MTRDKTTAIDGEAAIEVREDLVERQLRYINWPDPPRVSYELDLTDPDYYLGRVCSRVEREAYARAIGERAGWELVPPLGRAKKREGASRARYRRDPDETPPWSPAELRKELELCGGDWQAVAAALDVSYRKLARWNGRMIEALKPTDEILAFRDAHEKTGLPRDPETLRNALRSTRPITDAQRGPLLAAVRLVELYVAAVEDGRPVPEGIREYLRRAGWIA